MKKKVFYILLSCFVLLLCSNSSATAEILIPEKTQILYSAEEPKATTSLEYHITSSGIEIIVKPSEDLEVKSLTLHDKTHEKDYSARQVDDKGYYFLLDLSESEQSISIEISVELTSGQIVTFQAKPIDLQVPQNIASTNNSNNNNDTGNFDRNNCKT